MLVMGVMLAAVVFAMQTAFASNGNSGETRPGWGYGDKNHVHTGPPGQTVRPTN